MNDNTSWFHVFMICVGLLLTPEFYYQWAYRTIKRGENATNSTTGRLLFATVLDAAIHLGVLVGIFAIGFGIWKP